MAASSSSDDRLVTVLITTTLGRSRGAEGPPPLGPVGWSRLEAALDAAGHRPGELLTMPAAGISSVVRVAGFDTDRITPLLRRAGPVALDIERLADLGIWVMTSGDDDYPSRLRATLERGAPPTLFGAGERTLLSSGGLAIVGSRDGGLEADAVAADLARRAASGETTVISGAARGIDSAAMLGAIEAGGYVVGVTADRLDRKIRDREVRDAIMVDRLALVTPYVPSAGFSVRAAMGRNKLIYGLATAAVVVTSARGSGGTWAGATEALKLGRTPVLVWDGGDARGRAGLLEAGARSLPEHSGPITQAELEAWTAGRPPIEVAEPPQMGLFSEDQPSTKPRRARRSKKASDESASPPDVFAYIEREARTASTDFDLRRRLDEAPAELRAELAPHWVAFEYALRDAGDGPLHERFGGLGPRSAFPDGSTSPPLVEDVSPDVIAAWRTGLERVEAPLARARYGDLLWLLHEGDASTSARTAIDGYIELMERPESGAIGVAKSASRAVDLALEINDVERLARLGRITMACVRQSLASDAHEPGLVVRLATAACRIPRAQAPDDIDEVLGAIEERYKSEPPVLEGLADLQDRRAAPDGRASVRRRQVARWRERADAVAGGARMFHLQHALVRAQMFGLHPEIEELKLALQAVDRATLGLKTLETTVDVERGPIIRTVEQIVGTDSFAAALRRMVDVLGPLAGDPDDNAALVDEQNAEFPLQSLFPTQILGPDGTTIRIATTPDDHRLVGLARQEGLSIAFYATIVVEVMDAAVQRYGLPTASDIASSFFGPLVDRGLSDRLARGTVYYLNGDPDAAGHLIAPRLEGILRRLARSAGVLVVREPRGVRSGGVVSVGDVLNGLRGRLDEPWRRFFANLLADPLGHNLRNLIGHALIDEVPRESAALLIYAAVALAKVENEPRGSGAERPGDEAAGVSVDGTALG